MSMTGRYSCAWEEATSRTRRMQGIIAFMILQFVIMVTFFGSGVG